MKYDATSASHTHTRAFTVLRYLLEHYVILGAQCGVAWLDFYRSNEVRLCLIKLGCGSLVRRRITR
jgi:hypothetical protein